MKNVLLFIEFTLLDTVIRHSYLILLISIQQFQHLENKHSHDSLIRISYHKSEVRWTNTNEYDGQGEMTDGDKPP